MSDAFKGRWVQAGTCPTCGSPVFTPHLDDYRGLSAPPARRSCRCLPGVAALASPVLTAVTSLAQLLVPPPPPPRRG